MDWIQIKCKKCGGENIYKNGVVAGKQRYKCKYCGHHSACSDASSAFITLKCIAGYGNSAKICRSRKCLPKSPGGGVFAKVLPSERHVVGKQHTVMIERDNSNSRRHLGRFTRRTKVVFKSQTMVDLSLRIWHALTTKTEIFQSLRNTIDAIFR